MSERSLQTFRVHLIYKAEGMTRPLSFKRDLDAESCAEAVQLVVNEIRSAYRGRFETLTWTAENLSNPVELIYVSPGEGKGNGG